MKTKLTACSLAAFILGFQPLQAANLLAPGDLVRAIDTLDSNYPGGEPPSNAIDGSLNKYLNFGKEGSGFIVTPGASTVRSFQMTTANDASDRDPASYVLQGTNAAITSTEHSIGLSEMWTTIGSGSLGLPGARDTAGGFVNLTNSTAYSSYRMTFPTLVNSAATNSMQFAEIQFYSDADGGGSSILSSSNAIIAIDETYSGSSNYPGGEPPSNANDGTPSKYLNFGGPGSGFIIEPVSGLSIADGFQIMTANDADGRDPSSYMIYGGVGPVVSADNSIGSDESWTLIQEGSLSLTTSRETLEPTVPLSGNTTAYSRYKVVFPTMRGGNGEIMQIGEFILHGTPVPEPSTGLLTAAVGLCLLRRRSRR